MKQYKVKEGCKYWAYYSLEDPITTVADSSWLSTRECFFDEIDVWFKEHTHSGLKAYWGFKLPDNYRKFQGIIVNRLDVSVIEIDEPRVSQTILWTNNASSNAFSISYGSFTNNVNATNITSTTAQFSSNWYDIKWNG